MWHQLFLVGTRSTEEGQRCSKRLMCLTNNPAWPPFRNQLKIFTQELSDVVFMHGYFIKRFLHQSTPPLLHAWSPVRSDLLITLLILKVGIRTDQLFHSSDLKKSSADWKEYQRDKCRRKSVCILHMCSNAVLLINHFLLLTGHYSVFRYWYGTFQKVRQFVSPASVHSYRKLKPFTGHGSQQHNTCLDLSINWVCLKCATACRPCFVPAVRGEMRELSWVFYFFFSQWWIKTAA